MAGERNPEDGPVDRSTAGLPDASCFYLKKSQGFRLLTCANVSARAFGGSRFGRENVLVRWLSRGTGPDAADPSAGVSLWDVVLPEEVLRLPGAGSGGRVAGRPGVLRPVHDVLRPATRPPVHPDGGLVAADVRYRRGYE